MMKSCQRIAAVFQSDFRTKNGTHTTLTMVPNRIVFKRDNMTLQLKLAADPYKYVYTNGSLWQHNLHF